MYVKQIITIYEFDDGQIDATASYIGDKQDYEALTQVEIEQVIELVKRRLNDG